MLLTVIKFLMMILLISSSITIKFKIKHEKSILITFLSSLIMTYLFGLINQMIIALYVVLALDIISFLFIIFSIIKRKIIIKQIFTLGTIVYIILSFLLIFFVRYTHFSEWDEFSHWGPNLKAMYYNNLLWANNKWDGIHVVYQPLAGIMEWIVLKLNNNFSEDIAYIAIDLSILTFVIIFLKDLKYNLKDIIKVFLFIFSFYCITFLFSFSLTSIYIDYILGVVFGTGMFYAITCKGKKEDKVILILILISLAELKTTGLLFDIIILGTIFVKDIILPVIQNRKVSKNNIKDIGKIFLVILLLFSFYKSWNVYCKSNNRVLDRRHDNNFITEQLDIKEFIKAIIQFRCTNEKLSSISKSFYSKLNEQKIVKNYTIINLFVIFNVILILNSYLTKDSKDRIDSIIIIIGFNVGFVLYCLLLMGTYMFAFTDVEGRGLFSLDRYMQTYFIAWALNIMGLFLYKDYNKNNLKNKSIVSLLMISLVVVYYSNIQLLIKPTNKVIEPAKNYLEEKAEIVNENLTRNDKVFIVFQDPGLTVDPFMFRYYISPIVMNLMDEYCLSTKPYEKSVTLVISKEELEQKLIDENYDYVFVLKSNKDFIGTYGEIFDKEIDLNKIENHIFKINKIDESDILLTLYK